MGPCRRPVHPFHHRPRRPAPAVGGM